MFVLTDESIESGVESISGFIVATVSDQTGISVEKIAEAFFASRTYDLLSDKNTGYYWDSILELTHKFQDEIHAAISA